MLKVAEMDPLLAKKWDLILANKKVAGSDLKKEHEMVSLMAAA